MGANTIGSWTGSEVSVGGKATYVATCEITPGTTPYNACTKLFPKELDLRKKFTIVVSLSASIHSGESAKVALYGGYLSTFAVTEAAATSATLTAGIRIKELLDDLTTATAKVCIECDPNLNVAEVSTYAAAASGYKSKTPIFPYMAVGVECDGALVANAITFYLLQAR
jgi:hypothetical protein